MRRRPLLTATGAIALGALVPRPSHAQEGGVDLLLVLAVDVSRSIDDDEARLQRLGYRTALTDPAVLAAIGGGMIGAIGVAYVEWAGSDQQRLVLPWQRIDGPAAARAWAASLEQAPRNAYRWTSISGGLDFSRQVLAEAPFEGTRRVIDVSGDGVNNSGGPPELSRDEAVAEGITINALPIVNDRPTYGRPPPAGLPAYFQDSVIGGPGAFVEVAEDFASFGRAVRRKLIREIAGRAEPLRG